MRRGTGAALIAAAVVESWATFEARGSSWFIRTSFKLVFRLIGEIQVIRAPGQSGPAIPDPRMPP